MIEDNALAEMAGPSKQQILRATGLAMLVAAIILVTAVLPAEYGIDPLHTGAAGTGFNESFQGFRCPHAKSGDHSRRRKKQAPVIKGV